MNRTSVKRWLAIGGLALAAVTLCTPGAGGAMPYGTLTVYHGSGQATGYGSLTIQFTTGTNTAYVMASALNGKSAYTEGRFYKPGNSFVVQSKRSAAEYYVNVSRSALFSGSTSAPWYGEAKVCVDIPLYLDKCSAKVTGRVA